MSTCTDNWSTGFDWVDAGKGIKGSFREILKIIDCHVVLLLPILIEKNDAFIR